MDIGTGKGGIASRLSNLTARSFMFDEVECNSIEGVLQEFKFENHEMQKEICKLSGQKARRSGQKKNWKKNQTLYWKGKPIKRDSKEYQDLLDLLYQSAYEGNNLYKKDIDSCQGVIFKHSIGKRKKSDTVLTVSEFTSRLTKLRELSKEEVKQSERDKV